MEKKKNIAALIGFPLLVVSVLVLVVVFWREITGFFENRNMVRAWLESLGLWGYLAFVGIQIFQVVIFVIPGEAVQIAGGYVFGLWQGSLLSILGIMIGSSFNFYVGRLLGRSFVESILDPDKVKAIERVTGSGRAAAGFFLLFVIPGIPKDGLCYVAGFSSLPFMGFFVISMLGRLPGIVVSSLMGSTASEGNWVGSLIVLAIAVLLFAVGLVFRVRIEAFLTKFLHRGPKEGKAADIGDGSQAESHGEGQI